MVDWHRGWGVLADPGDLLSTGIHTERERVGSGGKKKMRLRKDGKEKKEI